MSNLPHYPPDFLASHMSISPGTITLSTSQLILGAAILMVSCLMTLWTKWLRHEGETDIPARSIKIYKQTDTKIDGSDHLSWHEYFMSVAELAAKRSKDPSSKVGACIVNGQNKIVATGYNGMPNGVDDKSVPWTKEGEFLETKYAYVVHAELNAILNSVLTDQTGCRLFVSLFPCNECAKAIIQSGIRHVIYLSDKHKDKDSTKASKLLLKLANVKYEQFHGRLLI